MTANSFGLTFFRLTAHVSLRADSTRLTASHGPSSNPTTDHASITGYRTKVAMFLGWRCYEDRTVPAVVAPRRKACVCMAKKRVERAAAGRLRPRLIMVVLSFGTPHQTCLSILCWGTQKIVQNDVMTMSYFVFPSEDKVCISAAVTKLL